MKKIASIFPHLLPVITQKYCRSESFLFGPIYNFVGLKPLKFAQSVTLFQNNVT